MLNTALPLYHITLEDIMKANYIDYITDSKWTPSDTHTQFLYRY